jgi:hypothetical protein
MRFTIWSALTNAFVIFTVILPSLIPGANAFYDVVLYFTNPSSSGAVYFAGQESEITWYVSKWGLGDQAGSYDRSLTAGIAGTSAQRLAHRP